MKKIILAVVVAVVSLGAIGCSGGKNKQIEYTYQEFDEIEGEFIFAMADEVEKLNDEQLFGKSDDPKEQYENMKKAYEKCADKAVEGLEIKRNQKVIISGYITETNELESTDDIGNINFSLKNDPEDNDFMGILCVSFDEKISEISGESPVKIEGVFVKDGCAISGATLFDCKVVE